MFTIGVEFVCILYLSGIEDQDGEGERDEREAADRKCTAGVVVGYGRTREIQDSDQLILQR